MGFLILIFSFLIFKTMMLVLIYWTMARMTCIFNPWVWATHNSSFPLLWNRISSGGASNHLGPGNTHESGMRTGQVCGHPMGRMRHCL